MTSTTSQVLNGNQPTKITRILAAPFQNTVVQRESIKRNGHSTADKKVIDFRTFTFKPLDKSGNVKMSQYCGPTTESNWVIPGTLLVGAYPATEDDVETFDLITSILKLGIRKFVCLQLEYRADVTPEQWRYGKVLRPYFEDVKQIVQNKHSYSQLTNNAVPVVDIGGLSFEHCPIVDCGITDDDRVLELCRKLVEDVSRGEIIYLHCWGGHGRTGTVVSIMLHLMYGLSAAEAMARCQLVHDLRVCPVNVGSPQTQTQRDQVTRIIATLEMEYRSQSNTDWNKRVDNKSEIRTGGFIGSPTSSAALRNSFFSAQPSSPMSPLTHHHQQDDQLETQSLHLTLNEGSPGKSLYTLAVNNSPHAASATYVQGVIGDNSNVSSAGGVGGNNENVIVKDTVKESMSFPRPLPHITRGPTSMIFAANSHITNSSNSPMNNSSASQVSSWQQQQERDISLLLSTDSDSQKTGGFATPTLRFVAPSFGASDDSLATAGNSIKSSSAVSNKFAGSNFLQLQERASPFSLSRENSGSVDRLFVPSSPERDSPLQPVVVVSLQTSSSDFGYSSFYEQQTTALDGLNVSTSPLLNSTLNGMPETESELAAVMRLEVGDEIVRRDSVSAPAQLFVEQQTKSPHLTVESDLNVTISMDTETDSVAISNKGNTSRNGSEKLSSPSMPFLGGSTRPPLSSNGLQSLVVGTVTAGDLRSREEDDDCSSQFGHVRKVTNTNSTPTSSSHGSGGSKSTSISSNINNTRPAQTTSTPQQSQQPQTSAGSAISQVINVARQVLSGKGADSSPQSTQLSVLPGMNSSNNALTASVSAGPTRIVPTPPTTSASTAARNTHRRIDSSGSNGGRG